ncbi:MAG: NAD(P)/FAD-dependent oxidoreductase [Flavisolibacter sp.]
MDKSDEKIFDIAIIGGGLAGLSAAIILSKKGYRVALIEKEKYPFHKVCGEYISMESWSFLKELGLPLDQMQLPRINSIQLTANNGKEFHTKLPLGGFGISRFLLDSNLAEIAKNNGTLIFEETKVEEVSFTLDSHAIYATTKTGSHRLSAKTCLAAYGKRSNLDIKWKRNFLHSYDKKLDNYIGVKYHIYIDRPAEMIGLHNFSQGYCGISRIEENKSCLCFLTKANNLKKNNNSIAQLEQNILFKNPFLKKIFLEGKVIREFPITISQINFNKKSQLEEHIFMVGDAAGMITPLCGNGMSMAMHSAKILSSLIDSFLNNSISRGEMERVYTKTWNHNFSKRLNTGRILQHFFGGNFQSNLLVASLRTFPFLATPLIKMTHGKEF